ncbi:hypothetical protein GE061_012055 [Apolygus lucorum]|uniref:NUC153 domain-containing protein n=1 Tax=Apolygus lucorum TaxID=248454 RepID=A0A8S9XR47_APOLU|nr:hypothetical protein GE061_012055 [Apolygus lucorum]
MGYFGTKMDDPLKDKRFSHVVSDPRFRKLPRSERKVKIDHRFKAMFTDDKFKLKYAVDKRGRPVEQTQADNLKKYYELNSGSDESSDDEEAEESNDEPDEKNQEMQDDSGDDDDSVDESQSSAEEIVDRGEPQTVDKSVNKEDHVQKEELESNSSHQHSTSEVEPIKQSAKRDQLKERSKMVDSVHKGRMKEVVFERLQDLTVDYARGIGTLGSDESSSDESTSEDSEEEEIFHPWGELANDADQTEDATARLAACNLDWDRITAKDLFILFTSFLPPEGFIKEVTIYPSEFGLQRMKEEELKGPKELFENPKFQDFDDDDFTDKHADGSQYCMEKLREYQLNRLRYYYAVITFNNPETANKIYTECDGIEYESSATKMDLRFIPDDMEFEHEPKESCTSMPDITKYKPRLFVNSALQQGTVRLTWDETDLNRVEFTKKLAGGEKINDDDLQAYIAASSDSDEEDKTEVENEDDVLSKAGDNPIEKYKALLSSVTNKKNKSNIDMEVSWGVGLGDKDSESEPEEADSDGDKTSSNKDKMQKGKSKNSSKKPHKSNTTEDDDKNAELELLLADDAAEERAKAHFNFKDIQKEESRKKKKRKHQKDMKEVTSEDKFEIDVKDSRFSALYTSHHFNIDPADPRFVRTEAAEKIIQEKQKRRKLDESGKSPAIPVQSNKKHNKMNAELASLVKSIKGKQAGS